MGKKFTELPAAGELTGQEIIAAVQNSVSRQTTIDDVKEFVNGGMIDYIVERGTITASSYTWEYEKWASGRYVCTRNSNGTGVALSVAENGIRRNQLADATWSIPSHFVASKGITFASANMVGAQAPVVWATVYRVNLTNSTVSIAMMAGTSTNITLSAYNLYVRLEGWWQ